MLLLIEEVDHHISDCKRRIEQQRRRILEPRKRGDDTTVSTNLLATFIHFLAIAVPRRETLRRLAQADLARPALARFRGRLRP
jgi:hypothetical protein